MGADKALNYYKFLDGLRGLAILGVLTAHATFFFLTQSHSGSFFKILNALGPLGHLGVDMFFVTSGFLITGILIPDYAAVIDIRRFYLRRSLKIIPPYWAVIVFLLIILLYDQRGVQGLRHFIPYLFLVQNYASELIAPMAHTWSLAIEEHFYLIFPLAVAAVFKIAKSENSRRTIIIWMGLVLMAVIILLRDVLGMKAEFLLNSQAANYTTTTLFRIDALMFGCVLRALEPYYARGRDQLWCMLSPLFVLAAIFIYYYFSQHLDKTGMIRCWGKFLWAYVAPGFLLIGVYRGSGWLKGFFEFAPLRWIGRNSYGIYLWHFPIIIVFAPDLVRYFGPQNAVAAFFVFALGVGFLSTITIERFALKMRAKICP